MKRKLPLILLSLFFLCVASYSGIRLYDQWGAYREGERLYRDLTQYVHQVSPSRPNTPAQETPADLEPVESTTAPAEPEANIFPQVDFDALTRINPQVVGWICIQGTNINYPIVQADDNSRYLNRLFDGTPNGAGSIFLDYRNDSGLSDRNSILYGHHMKNGTMFQQITCYKDQSFYEAHPTALVMTPHGNYTLEFIAGYVTGLNTQAWKLEFGSEEEFTHWLEEAVARSTFAATTDITPGDRVMTLSTCTYEYDDARYVLIGILREHN